MGLEVALQNHRVQTLERLLDGRGLGEQIYAVLVVLDHLKKTVKLALDDIDPFPDRFELFGVFVGLRDTVHSVYIIYPLGVSVKDQTRVFVENDGARLW